MKKNEYEILTNFINHLLAIMVDICIEHKLGNNIMKEISEKTINVVNFSLIPYLEHCNKNFNKEKFLSEIIQI